MPQRSKLESILNCKCPRCREGDLFTHAPYQLSHFDKMYVTCPICRLNYDIEPGFYTGAMYVSYAFSVAIMVTIGIFLNLVLDDPDIIIYLVTIFCVIIALFPLLFRYSRVLYLHWFGGVKYDPDCAK